MPNRILASIALFFIFGYDSYASMPTVGNLSKRPSEVDVKFAKRLKIVHKQLRKNSINIHSVNKMIAYTKISKTFRIYHPVFKIFKKIFYKNKVNLPNLLSSCKRNRKNKSILERPIYNKTLDLINYYCIGKYLKIKISSPKNTKKISIGEKNFLKDNLAPLLAGRHKRAFIKFLDRIKEGSSAHVFISDIVTSFYINLNKVPSRKILPHLIVDEYLTSYVQFKGLIDKKAIGFFKSEFRSLYRKAIKNIEKGEDSEIKKSLGHLQEFYSSNKNYISDEKSFSYFKNIIKRLISQRKFSIVDDFSKESVSLAPFSVKNEMIFLRLWTLSVINKPEKALTFVKKNNLIEKFKNLNSNLRYWTALTLKKVKGWEVAKPYFLEQISLAPINYYSILSFKQLQKYSKDVNAKKLFTQYAQGKEVVGKSIPETYVDLISRLDVWIHIHHSGFIVEEIENFLKNERLKISQGRYLAASGKMKEEKKTLTLRLIDYLNKKKKYLTAFKVLYDSIDRNLIGINERVLRFLFPFQYMKTIERIGGDIDPLIVLSLIRQESAFDPRAVSVVGARGLMQLMPRTARRFKPRVRTHHLKNPKLNISIGIKYLKILLKKYQGNLIYALAAYNAGEGNVNNWIRERFTSDTEEELIEEIPFKETRKYVKLIYRNLFFYNMLAGKEDFIAQNMSKTFRATKY